MQNGKFGVVNEKTLLASRIYGCATSDDQGGKIEAGACLLANFFFSSPSDSQAKFASFYSRHPLPRPDEFPAFSRCTFEINYL